MQKFSILPREMAASLWRNRSLDHALDQTRSHRALPRLSHGHCMVILQPLAHACNLYVRFFGGIQSTVGNGRGRKQNGFRNYSFRRIDRAWALRRMHQSGARIDTLQCQLCEKGHFPAGNTSVGRIWLRAISYCHKRWCIAAGATHPQPSAASGRRFFSPLSCSR